MKKIISYLIFFHFFSFQAKSQLPKDEEDKLIKIVSDTLPKLNLISIKLMKENSGNKVFIDTVEFNLPHKFLLNASLFIKSGVLDDYISIRQDTFQYKIFTIKKSLIKRSLSKRKVFSNFKTYLNNAKNNDAYFSFYKYVESFERFAY